MLARIERFIYFVVMYLLTLGIGHAISPYQPLASDPVLEPWRWRSFSELEDLGIRCLTEGTDGAIWFGGTSGVRRYDGIKWTVYTTKDDLGSEPVNALCATRDGSIYAGTNKGIIQLKNGHNTQF